MSLFWLTFPPALFLLLPPIGWFHRDTVHYRAISRDWRGHWSQILSLRLHLLDLVRAALGGWLLRQAVLSTSSGATTAILHAVVLALAVALQTLVCRAERAALAPFAFTTGLVLGYCLVLGAGFALVLTVALTAGLRLPALFFPLLGLSVAGAEALFRGPGAMLDLAPIASAVALPWLLMLLSRRRFVVAYLAGHSTRSGLRHTTVWR